MATLAHRSALGGPGNGGVPARRAVIRWAGRLFRREWRQQLLVVTLLTVALAAAIGSLTVADNTRPVDDAEMGSASDLLRFDGSDPPGPSQVAVTDGTAELLQLEIGETLGLDGRRRTVVGIVENPRKLSDEFALVSPSSARAPGYVTVLVGASEQSRDSFVQSQRDGSAFVGGERGGRGDGEEAADTLAMFSVATVFLLLASLVAAAGFAVVAQRRLRQLGMLAAIGATEKHLRLVLLANGAIVGAIAALCGTIVGLALWIAVAPTLESAIDHRIDRLSLPWELLATT